MSVDNLFAPVRLVLTVLERSFATVGWAASTSANVLAATKRELRRPTPVPGSSMRQERIADVIVLSDERKHER
jgi:hypothetical protein